MPHTTLLLASRDKNPLLQKTQTAITNFAVPIYSQQNRIFATIIYLHQSAKRKHDNKESRNLQYNYIFRLHNMNMATHALPFACTSLQFPPGKET